MHGFHFYTVLERKKEWNEIQLIVSKTVKTFHKLLYCNIFSSQSWQKSYWLLIFFFSFQIIKDRVELHNSREMFAWNHPPGALLINPQFNRHRAAFPFYTLYEGALPSEKFTAVILARTPIISISAPIMRLMSNVANSNYAAKVGKIMKVLQALIMCKWGLQTCRCG